MSTSTLASQRTSQRSLNWRTLLIAGVIVAIIAAVTALALTSSTSTTKSLTPARVVLPVTPAVAAHGFGIDHPLPHAVIESSALSSGMGHR